MFLNVSGTELPVVLKPTAQHSPAIWHDRIVWQDYRNDPVGNWTGTGLGNSDIFLFNLTTGVEKQITFNTSAQEKPRIYGDIIVWVDYRHGNADIYMYDLKTNEEKRITFNSANQLEPVIFDDKIVWRDLRQSPDHPMCGDIYMYDIKQDIIKPVSIQTSPPFDEKFWSDAKLSPAIYKSKIVWYDWRVSLVERYDTDIYMYDLGDDCIINTDDDTSDSVIAESNKFEFNPTIYGNKIAYLALNDSYCDLILYDIKNGERKHIVSQRVSSSHRPALFGTNIVWVDASAATDGGPYRNYDIYAYDFTKNELKPVCTANGTQIAPALFGNITVWQDYRNGNWDIYAYIEHQPYNTPPSIKSVYITPTSAKNDGATPVRISAEVDDLEDNIESVYADLSSIGLGVEKLYDNGSFGDLKPFDNNYTLNFTVPFCIKTQNYSIKILAIDFENTRTCEFVNTTVVSSVPPVLTGACAEPARIINDGTYTVLFKVKVQDPDDYVKQVIIRLDAVGLMTTVMYDDGTHGDEVKNDSVYSIKVKIPVQRATKDKVIYIWAIDSFNNNAKCMIFLKLLPPPLPVDIVSVTTVAIIGVLVIVFIIILFERRIKLSGFFIRRKRRGK